MNLGGFLHTLGVCLVVGFFAVLAGGAGGALAADLMGPLTAVLLFQGLAVAHAVVRGRKLSGGWLVALYLLLLVPPHLALPVLAGAGLLDGWLGFRARAGRT